MIKNEIKKAYERRLPGNDDPQFILRFINDMGGYWRCGKEEYPNCKLKQLGEREACITINESHVVLNDNSQLPGNIGCSHMEYVTELEEMIDFSEETENESQEKHRKRS